MSSSSGLSGGGEGARDGARLTSFLVSPATGGTLGGGRDGSSGWVFATKSGRGDEDCRSALYNSIKRLSIIDRPEHTLIIVNISAAVDIGQVNMDHRVQYLFLCNET
jgi:hypothetical protein